MSHEEEIIKQIDLFYSIISKKDKNTTDWLTLDWLTLKNLFLPQANVLPLKSTFSDQQVIPIDRDVYIERLKLFLADKDFYENGFDYRISIYGNLAMVYSRYSAKRSFSDDKLLKSGTNIINLVYIKPVWKISFMQWQDD